MFTYRWLLLDCKREFPFKDIFRVLETIWSTLPIDRFESIINPSNTSSYADRDDCYTSMNATLKSLSTTTSLLSIYASSCLSSGPQDETQSQYSSVDGSDSGYRDEMTSVASDMHSSSSTSNYLSTITSTPLGQWLTNLSSIDVDDDDDQSSDMFTIFLCIAILEQNRTWIMQISSVNHDNDDCIGTYFTRHVRQHDARHALSLARDYHRQYMHFQIRRKQLFMTEKNI
jgi:hypothetical protein